MADRWRRVRTSPAQIKRRFLTKIKSQVPNHIERQFLAQIKRRFYTQYKRRLPNQFKCRLLAQIKRRLSSHIIRRSKRRIRACKCCISYITPISEEEKKASKASSDSRMKKLKLALQSDYEDLPEPSFQAICIKAAELEAYSRHPNSDRNEEKVQKDMHRSVDAEILKQDQARRAITCSRITAYTLLGVNKTASTRVLKRRHKPPKKYGGERTFLKLGRGLLGNEETKAESVKTKKKPMIIKLTGVTIFPKVNGQGGDNVFGTLEAHEDKFLYTTSDTYFRSQLTCDYENVKEVLFQVEEDKKMLPLLHFHLHQPIKVGTEMTKHIQFRMVPASLGKRRSDKFEKEKLTSNRDLTKDLKNFVDKVQWQKPRPPFPFRGVFKEDEFHGVYKEENPGFLPSKTSGVFILTLSLLVHLRNTPFFAVNLRDIAFVNLARLRPQEIDMTVVFKDFTCPVLQISAIPIESLDKIKSCLSFVGVKMYDNNVDLNWNSVLKEILKKPEEFVKGGGWDAYGLEDIDTLLYYKHFNLEASEAVCASPALCDFAIP